MAVSLSIPVYKPSGTVPAGQMPLPLKRFQLGLADFLHCDRLDLRQLRLQPVQKQRVDDLMDVLNTGIVHPAGAPGLRVQCAFKHRPEDRGADGGPVKILAGLAEQKVDHLIPKPGDLDVFIGKQTAVDVGERRQVLVQIRVPVLRLLVQHPEQVTSARRSSPRWACR